MRFIFSKRSEGNSDGVWVKLFQPRPAEGSWTQEGYIHLGPARPLNGAQGLFKQWLKARHGEDL